METVYRRFFEIKDAATLARINELRDKRSAYNKQALDFTAEIGAETAYTRSERISGFDFKSEPDLKVWKEGRDGWVPRLNTKGGKAMQARIDDLNKRHEPEPLDNALTIAGLNPGFPVLLEQRNGRGVGYRVGICGFPGEAARWFAGVPWRDKDPAKLAEYKTQREGERHHWSSELDHLLWTPPAEWVEVKEWEVQKALDEYKESAAQQQKEGKP